MKIYISLPMTGYTKTVKRRYDEAYKELIQRFGNDVNITGPTNVDDFDDNGLDPNSPNHTWAWHMGEDVKVLLECDAIYLCRGWFDSEGCRIERAIAVTHNIKIYNQPNSDTFLPKDMKDED